jgi:hypothetical protein
MPMERADNAGVLDSSLFFKDQAQERLDFPWTFPQSSRNLGNDAEKPIEEPRRATFPGQKCM